MQKERKEILGGMPISIDDLRRYKEEYPERIREHNRVKKYSK